MVVALRIQRVRGRPRTRAALWLGAVAASTLTFAGFFLFGFSRLAAGSLSQIPQEVRPCGTRWTIKLPPVLERMAGGKERIKAQQEMTKGMVDSPAFIWWSIVVGTAMMCVIQGTLVGSIAWALAMAAGRIAVGRWPLGAPPEPAAPTAADQQY